MNNSRFLKFNVLIIVFSMLLYGCQFSKVPNSDQIVEEISIVQMKAVNKEGEYIIEVSNAVVSKKTKKIVIQDSKIWDEIKEGDSVTLRFGDRTYIKAINRSLTYEYLTGHVVGLFESDNQFFATFEFDQIGKELSTFRQSAWSQLEIGQKVKFTVGTEGNPERLILEGEK